MREFQKKQNIKRALYSKPVLVLMGIVFLFLVYVTWNMYTKAMVPQANRISAEEELAELQAREVELMARIEMLGTEEGIELEVRDKFGLVRDGEEVVVIVEDTSSGGSSDRNANNISLWQKILRVFGM